MLVDHYIFKKHLEEGETVSFVAHKHWTQFLPKVLNITFFGFLFPWIFYLMGLRFKLFVILILAWMFLALIRFVYDWINWYADVWLFTNMSVIIVEWKGIFSNTSQRIGYEDVEGVAFTIKGFWGTVMHFGDATLHVLSGSHMILHNARNPKELELALMKHQGDFLHGRDLAHSDTLKQLLSQMVAQHIRRK